MTHIPKITLADIKTTIDHFSSITSDIHIATHLAGGNNVSMRYNVNYKTFTITNRGVEYYATNRKKAIELFNAELYRIN